MPGPSQIILGEKTLTKIPPDRGSPPGTPRWVKVIVIIFILLILLVVILHLMGLGFGGHGPSDLTLLKEHGLQQL